LKSFSKKRTVYTRPVPYKAPIGRVYVRYPTLRRVPVPYTPYRPLVEVVPSRPLRPNALADPTAPKREKRSPAADDHCGALDLDLVAFGMGAFVEVEVEVAAVLARTGVRHARDMLC